ncbi:MAG: hypothetical protein F6J87_05960 [Spirulina sp. SIO3F2]|nr:hypothetical protein [Spirulina sp. SIO3F2]
MFDMMIGLNPHSPDKQVFLKFSGSLRMDTLQVELEILEAGDRNRTSGVLLATLPVPPDLCSQIQHHWEDVYRRYCRQGRAIVMKDINFNLPTPQACRDSAQALSTTLNTWLQQPEFRELREKLIAELNRNEQIQFLVQSDELSLQQLPWPDWDVFQRYAKASIDITSPRAQRHPQQPIAERTPAQRLRILGIIGAGENIDIASDWAMLEALPSELVEVKILHQPHLYELTDQLWEQTWDMIVFAGHGDQDAAGQGFLELNDQGELLKFNEIWYGLRKAVRSGLQLALFNSCLGLGLLAQNLQDDAQIPHMIVMRDLVPDKVAQAFLKYFLQDFVAGQPIPVAANRARERLQALETDYPCATWLPVIWQNPYALPLRLTRAEPELGAETLAREESAIAPPPNTTTSRSRLRRPVLVTCSLLLISITAFVGSRSPAAQLLNTLGIKARSERQFSGARRLFGWASWLDPNYPQPLYNLGYTYDQELGERDLAISYYKRAAYLDYPPAIAEYVRLLLLAGEDNYYAMLTLSDHCLDQTEYKGIEVSCLKNKGWIQFRKQRWVVAERHLRAALDILDDAPHTHCLLAQTLEAQDRFAEALPHWNYALQFGVEKFDEHDHCMALAEARLLRSEPANSATTPFPPL